MRLSRLIFFKWTFSYSDPGNLFKFFLRFTKKSLRTKDFWNFSSFSNFRFVDSSIFWGLVRVPPPRRSLVSTPLHELLVDDRGTTTTRGTQPCALSRTHPRVVLFSFHLTFTAFAHSPHSRIPEEIRDQNIRDEVLPAANMSSARPTSAAAHRAWDGSGSYPDF